MITMKKIEELTDRELQEKLLINIRIIKANSRTIATWVIIFGIVMIIGVIGSIISSGILD
jgi:hypothetical protein